MSEISISTWIDVKKSFDSVDHDFLAHYLNLLAKDVEVADVKETIVKINKYFRNVHLPAAWYKSAGGKKLVLPIEEYLRLIKPIAVALDEMQNDSTKISHAVEIWKELA